MMMAKTRTDDNMNTLMGGGGDFTSHRGAGMAGGYHQGAYPPPHHGGMGAGGGGHMMGAAGMMRGHPQQQQQSYSQHMGGTSASSGPNQVMYQQKMAAYGGHNAMQGQNSMMQYRDSSRSRSPSAAYQHHQQPPAMRPQNSFGDDDRPTSPEDLQGYGYGHDRIQNDLLDEICSDIGIKDAMDLDFLDFDGTGGYMFNQGPGNQGPGGTRLPADLDSVNDPMTFGGDMPGHDAYIQLGSTAHQMARAFTRESATDNEKLASQKVDSPYAQSVPSVTSVKSDVISDSKVDSPTVSSSSSMDDCPVKTSGTQPASVASLGSPAVHSTTSHDRPSSNGSVDASVPSPGKKHNRQESSDSTASCPSSVPDIHANKINARSSSVDSSVRSPLDGDAQPKSTGNSSVPLSRRHNSVDNLSPKSPAVIDLDAATSTSSNSQQANSYLHKKSGFTANLMGGDLKTSFSQPASPAKSKLDGGMMKAQSLSDNLNRDQLARSLANHAAFQQQCGQNTQAGDATSKSASQQDGFKVPQGPVSGGYHDNRQSHAHKLMKENLPPRATESPFDGGYYSTGSPSVCTSGTSGSHYGSSTNLSALSPRPSVPDVKEEPQEDFHLSSLPSASDLNIPSLQGDGNSSGASSQPDSPSAMHVAKRPRIINSGSDLLEEMRERYSFVKGASIYDPPSRSASRPQSQMPSPVRGGDLPDSQFNFPPTMDNRFGQGPNNMGMSNQQGMGNSNMQGSMQPQGGMGVQNKANMPPQNQGPMSGSSMPNMAQQDNMGNRALNVQQGMGNQAMGMGDNMSMQQQNMGANMNRQGAYMNKMGQDMSGYQQEPSYQGNPPAMMNNNQNMYGYNSQQRQGMQQTGNMGMGQGMQQGVPPVAQAKMYPGMEGQQQQQQQQGIGGQYMNPMQQGQQHQQGYMGGMGGDPSKQGMYPGRMGPNQAGMQQQGYPPQHTSQNNSYNRSQYQQQPGMGQGGPGYMGPQGNNPYQQQQANMGNYNQAMQGMPAHQRPGSNSSHQPGAMNNMPPQPGGAPGDLQMNSAQTFSVNQPLGSQLPPHQQPLLPQDPTKPMTAQQGLMHSIINDRSSAFRTHPLFPLLRDLIIADMNFHTPSFPFQLIANLPGDFDKLLLNYQNRNPINRNYPVNQSIDGVIMDALRYAHQSLIEKIQVKKREVGYQDAPKPLTAIEDFCERFDRAVKNSMSDPPGTPPANAAAAAVGAGNPGHYNRHAGSLPSTPSKSKSDSNTAASQDKPKTTATAGRNKVLPKEAVQAMLEWLREHQDNPYPNDDEKEMLINKTKLTINQINYWFTNARRRILPKWALQRYMEQQQNRGPQTGPFGARMTAT